MKLMNPSGQGGDTNRTLAPRLASLDGARVGLLTNGKHNADVLLQETGKLFAERHGCEVVPLIDKRDAGKPSPPEHLEALVAQADFLITAVGD